MTDESVDPKQLQEAILRYLEARPPDWKWFMGRNTFSRDETIQRFKKDQKFRILVLRSALLKAINDFKA